MDNSQFSIQIKCFKLVGLRRHQLENNLKLRNLLYLFIAFPLIFCNLSATSYAIENFHDILASADAFAIVFTGYLALSKFATFCFSKEKFFEIMDDIKMLSENGKKSF